MSALPPEPITTNPQRGWWPLSLLVVGAVYFVTARLGLVLASIHGSVSPVWPATGVAIGTLLIGGRHLWPGIALGAFAANALTPVPLLVAAWIGAGNTLEAITGAWIVSTCASRLRRSSLDHLAEPAGFVLAALFAPMVSATLGVLALLGGTATATTMAGALWWTWWVGDSLGTLMVAPLLVAIRDMMRPPRRWTARSLGLAAALLLVTAAVGWLVFFQPAGSRWLFAVFPVLLLAVVCFGSPGVKLTAFLVSAIGIGATYFQSGPFAGGALNEDLLHLQLFLTSVGTAALILPVFPAHGRLLPSALLMLAWALSGWLFSALHHDRVKSDEARFNALVDDTAGRIRQRLTTYEDSLRGGAGLFLATPSAGAAEWRAYAEALRLPERYPGIEGIGVVFPVAAAQADAFVARVRAEGLPDFAITRVPEAVTSPEPRSEHFVLTYIEPRAANRLSLGLDLATEPNRRRAAEDSRSSGEPRITRPITLVQDEQHRHGFLLFVPLYRAGASLATATERRAACLGWVNAPFVTESFLRGVLGAAPGEIGLHFFDGNSTGLDHLLYTSPGSSLPADGYERVSTLELGGQLFTVGWMRGPAFVTSTLSAAIWAATSSTLVSLLMVGLVVGLQTANQRARRLATERTEALATAEERLRHLVDNVQDYGIFILDGAGRVATWNAGAERNTGYTAAEIIGRHFSVFYPPADAAAGRPARELAAAATQGRVEDEGWRVRKDGSTYWANVTVTVLRSPDGHSVEYLKIVRDVSDRKRLEESLAQARDEALQASRLKSEFLATMSHEIRTPMNSIIGMSGLLLDSDPTSEQRLMARVIQNGAESLLAILDDILDFAKIEAGKLRLDPADFNLRQVVEETLALHAPRAHQKRLELICTCDAALAPVLLGDAGRIRQVLTNLVSNAIKFTEQGEISVGVDSVGEQSGRQTVRLTVRDTGIGLTPEARTRLFEPFTQGDGSASRRFGGTGLGLAICRQLVELMQGRMGFDSAPGRGSTFWFELDLPVGTTPVPAEPLASFPPGLRILVVDDNATNRWILLEQLSHFGLDVKAVADGTAALAWLWAQAAVRELPHLVLLDHQMPGMSGLQLAEEIRADPTLRHLPLMMLSSTGPLEDPNAAAAVGFAACLVKPVREAQLHRALARILSGIEMPRPTAKTPQAKTPVANALRLLFAEDNKDNQLVLRMLFEKLGHTVVMANNGEEAIARLAQEPFDAVIMDCQMPLMDGYEATRQIRSGTIAGINPRIPIIALTANVMPGERQKCLSVGMDDYLSKPVRMSAVQASFLRCGLFKGPMNRTKA